MENKETKNEVAVAQTGYVTKMSAVDFSEDLDGVELQFETVKIPSGGGIAFEVINEDGEPDTAKEIKGVIVAHHPMNSYYSDSYNGTNNPPDCYSNDGKQGIFDAENKELAFGTCNGDCKTCQFNKYGSADDGKGKACKNKRRLYILQENKMFPIMINLPTGSLAEFSKYVSKCLMRGIKTKEVVTKITLKKAQSSGGITYSQAQFAIDRKLTDDEKKSVEQVAKSIKAMSATVAPDQE